jgi:hypothetical protein
MYGPHGWGLAVEVGIVILYRMFFVIIGTSIAATTACTLGAWITRDMRRESSAARLALWARRSAALGAVVASCDIALFICGLGVVLVWNGVHGGIGFVAVGLLLVGAGMGTWRLSLRVGQRGLRASKARYERVVTRYAIGK